jgi:structural maintenance of chromosome 4
MKPKGSEHDDGLLEYLEDIIGTAHYKDDIDSALVEMEALAEQRGDKLNRLRLIEKEKNSLEDKKREAEDYLRLQNELVRAKSILYQWYLWKALQSEKAFQENIVGFSLHHEKYYVR